MWKLKGGKNEALDRVISYVRHTKAARNDMWITQNNIENLGEYLEFRITLWISLGYVGPRRIFHNLDDGALTKKYFHK